jgi:hypothetical protein
LQLDADYTFQLILRTSAGTYPSNVIKVRTHKISDTSGISVCFGNVADPTVLEDAKNALQEMGAKWSDKIQIDTTHFVCNTPATAGAGPLSNTPGVEYQRALQLSIPVVQPTWILACHAEHKYEHLQGKIHTNIILEWYPSATTTSELQRLQDQPQEAQARALREQDRWQTCTLRKSRHRRLNIAIELHYLSAWTLDRHQARRLSTKIGVPHRLLRAQTKSKLRWKRHRR